MSDVPGEILFEILSRLPVVPLIRFRSVSKSWKCLIDSNEFITHHLNHSLKNINSNLKIILESRRLYSADLDLLNETNQADLHELDYPLKNKLGKATVLGSCHGLLALSNDTYHKTTILWNPSVRRFHQLPYECLDSRDVKFISHGFGYDAVSDDYKLVRMVQVREDADTVVKVYGLKSDSWRRIPDLPYNLRYRSAEFANGALHWDVRSKVNSDTATLVIAFDLGTEMFNLVPLPEFAVNTPCGSVFELGGCLSFMIYNYETVDIWVMKEYGVLESWSFLFSFNLSFDFTSTSVLAFSKCNRKVLIGLDDAYLMWYDLDKKTTDSTRIEMPVDMSYGTYTCMQSLVLLNSGTCDKKGKPER